VFEERHGANPFQFGLVGSTDNHDATGGNTEEVGWEGGQGNNDASPAGQIRNEVRTNPGGLAVVWAEENSRDAIFEGLRRRETYATSGTRPAVRFFAGNYPGLGCEDADLVARAYAGGAPMGAEIGAVRGGRSPQFIVWAVKDPGAAGQPGTDLQRLQVVKGWVDKKGQPQERVFEVAGDAENGAGVDAATCNPTGAGSAELCTVWRDPTFNPRQRAFYYVRALENPTCRWSTRVCKEAGVDPFSPACSTQAAAAGEAFTDCCLGETNDPFLSPVIQERAWTSPIWYRPEAIAQVAARVKFGAERGRDTLEARVRFRRVPRDFDPVRNDLTITVRDDDEIFGATIPAGTLRRQGPGLFVFTDKSGRLGGLRLIAFGPCGRGFLLKLRTRLMDLVRADRSDHMVTVTLGAGAYRTSHTRLWRFRGTRLETRGK
jgi:hypothetical protein